MDVGELSLPAVETCDEDLMPALHARKVAKLYFYLGFACLPWFWVTNIWLFSPDFWHGNRDPVVAKYTRRSAAGFAVYSCMFLSWTLMYLIAGERILGKAAYDALDINSLDLGETGLGAG